jgi:hypothetical protein
LWDAVLKRMVISRDVTFSEVSNDKSSAILDESLGDSSSVGDIPCKTLGEKGEKGNVTSTPMSETGNGSDQTVQGNEEVEPELMTNYGAGDDPVDCFVEDSANDAVNDESGVRKSSRNRRPPGTWVNCALISTTTNPTTFNQAMKRPDSVMWKHSIQCEYDSLMKHGTWTLVPRPINVNVIACKWVLKTKMIKNNAGLDALKYKSRLVAKGYSQIHGIDYEETFAPVVKFTSIRILLALVAHFDLELHQMDVVTAILNGDINEIIHMEQPEGFVKPGNADSVCRLHKVLYGLKQANRKWYAKMENFCAKTLDSFEMPPRTASMCGSREGRSD